jgi:hypothetical protein
MQQRKRYRTFLKLNDCLSMPAMPQWLDLKDRQVGADDSASISRRTVSAMVIPDTSQDRHYDQRFLLGQVR